MLVYPEDKWHELSFSKLINFSNSDLVGGRKRARNNQVKFSAYMFEFYKIEIVTFNSCCEDLSFLCRGEWKSVFLLVSSYSNILFMLSFFCPMTYSSCHLALNVVIIVLTSGSPQHTGMPCLTRWW